MSMSWNEIGPVAESGGTMEGTKRGREIVRRRSEDGGTGRDNEVEFSFNI